MTEAVGNEDLPDSLCQRCVDANHTRVRRPGCSIGTLEYRLLGCAIDVDRLDCDRISIGELARGHADGLRGLSARGDLRRGLGRLFHGLER